MKRYAIYSREDGHLHQNEHGEGVYCHWSDVEPLIAERDALSQFAEARRVQIVELMDENERLKAEVNRLNELISESDMVSRFGDL